MAEQFSTNQSSSYNLPAYRSIALRLPFLFAVTLIGIAVVATLSVNGFISSRTRGVVRSNLQAIANSESNEVSQLLQNEIIFLENVANNPLIIEQVELLNEEFENAGIAADDLQEELETAWLRGTRIRSVTPAMIPVVNEFLSNPASVELKQQNFAGLEGENGLLVVNRDGIIVGATYIPSAYNYRGADWIQDLSLENPLYLSGRVLDKSTPAVDITDIAMPITHPRTGEVLGYVRGAFDFENVEAIIHEGLFDQSGRTVLLNNEGGIIYTVAYQNSLAPYNVPTELFQEPETADNEADLFEFLDTNGTTYLATSSAINSDNSLIEGLEWKIASIQPAAEALAPIDSAILPAILTSSIFSFLAVAILYTFYIRPLTTDLNILQEKAVQLQESVNTHPVHISREDELGTLARTFNQMAARMRHELYTREQVITERTSTLEKRTTQLEASVRVGREANSSLDLDQLMQATVNLIREASNYYHASIFLIDDAGEYAVVRESTGEVGQIMKSNSHRLAVGSNSIVGQTTKNRQPFLARNVGEEFRYFNNPLLPDTQSEVALPLIAQGELLGALDVQSKQIDAFTTEDLNVLQLMADQVASAIYNARLYANTLERTEHQRRIIQLWKQMGELHNTNEILKFVCQELVEQFNFEGVYISEIDGLELVTQASAASEELPPVAIGVRRPMDIGAHAQVIQDEHSLLIRQKSADDPSLYDTDLPQAQSEIVVPIVTGRQISHLLTVYSLSPNNLTENDETLLQLLAEAIGSTIANTQLLSEKDQSLQELNRLYAQTISSVDSLQIVEGLYEPNETHLQDKEAQPRTIPLIIREQTIGEIVVESADSWSEEQQSLITAVADQTAFALENSRLFAQTQIRLREQEALYSLTSHLTATLDEQEIYRRATEAFVKQLYINQCLLTTWEKQQDTVTVRAEYIQDRHNPAFTGHYTRYEVRTLADYPGTLAALENREPQIYVVDDPDLTPSERNALKDTKQTKALEVPLVSGDLILGTIVIFRDDSQPRFDEVDVRLAQAMATQTAVALQNALLTTRARAQITQLSALNRISRQLTVAETVGDIYTTTRREVLSLTNATGLSIMVITQENKVRWAYAYEYGSENDLSSVPLQEFGTGLTGHVLRTREPLLLTKNKNLDEYLVATGSFSVGVTPNAWLGVPMVATDKLLGAIVIESENVNAFDDRHIQLMSTIASTVGIALSSLQQFNEIQQRRAAAEALYAIGRNISMSSSPEETLIVLSRLDTLRTVNAMAINLFEFTAGVTQTEPSLRVYAGWQQEGTDYHPLITPNELLTTEEQPFVDRLNMNEPLILEVTDQAGDLVKQFTDTHGIKSVAAFPLVVGQAWIGYLAFYHSEYETYDQERIRNLNSLVSQIAAVVQNQRLLTQTQEALAAQERQSLQLQTAAEVAAAASSSNLRELYALMQNSVDLIKERFDLYYVGIFLLNEKDGYATLAAGTGEEGRAQIARQHQLKVGSRSLVGGAVEDGEPRIHQNVYEAKDWFPNPNLPETRSEIALPLKVRGRITGALTVQSTEAYMFPPEFVSVLQTMTNQIAIAIDNADLFTQVQRNLLQTAALYETSRQLTESDSEYAVYKTLIDYVERSGAFDAAYVMTADPSSTIHRYIPIIWNLEEPADVPNPRRVRATNSIPRRSDTSPFLIIPDVSGDNYFSSSQMRTIFELNKIRSCCMLRIFVNDLWVASIALLGRGEEVPTEADLQPFIALADQAAVILSNQRLFKETSALYRLGRSLSAAMTREDVAHVTIEEIVAYTNVEQSRVIAFNEELTQAEIVAQHQPLSTGKPKLISRQVIQSLHTQFMDQRRPLLFEDDGSDDVSEIIDTFLRPYGIKTTLMLPAYSQESVLGFITLDSLQGKQQFTETVINFAQVAVDQFKTTIENIIFFDEALRRAQELITLNQISSRISATLDTSEIGQIVFNEVQALIQNDTFLLAEYDNNDNSYDPILFAYKGRQIAQKNQVAKRIQLNSSLISLLHEGEMVVLNKITDLSDEIYEMIGRPTEEIPASTIFIPMRQEGEPSGFVAVQKFQPYAYTAEEINILRSISNQTVLGLSNARLLQETRENVTELRTLFNVTQSISSSINANDRIERMVDTLYHSLRGASITILLLDEGQKDLEIIVHRGRLATQQLFTLDDSLIGKAIHYGTPMLMNDLRELEGYKPQVNDALAQIAVPLTFSQKTIGVINVESVHTDVFTERDLRLLQTLSASLAATIESGRLFQEIQAANEQLRELDRMKTQFLANMSHELRTPLNSIIGFSRLILKGIDGPITDMQKEDLNSIYNSGQHLLNLINDILDLAKIDAGKMALVFDKVNLNELCQSVLSTARGLVRDESIHLNWNIESDLPFVEADPVRLRQILLNLLSNAAKFTDKGHIALTVKQTAHKEVLISIEDTGIGIAEKDFPKLFKAFEQVDDSPSRAVDGTGLGLPIVHELVQLHHGSIWFESKVGTGSTFYITLPISQSTIPREYHDSSTVVTNGNGVHNNGNRLSEKVPSPPRPAILLVDDEPGILALYQRYLNSQTFELISVESGQAALDELAKRPDNIVLVVMDTDMPNLTGWEVLQQIQQNPDLKEIPVVLCSVEDNHDQADKLGAYQILPKPIIADDLLKIIETINIPVNK